MKVIDSTKEIVYSSVYRGGVKKLHDVSLTAYKPFRMELKKTFVNECK